MTVAKEIVPNILNSKLDAWTREMAALCQPDNIHWCDGSDAENEELCKLLVKSGTFTKLNPEKRPGSYLARSHPSDVARVEERTFICSNIERTGARTTNNWADSGRDANGRCSVERRSGMHEGPHDV